VLAILGFTKVPTRAIGYTGAMLRATGAMPRATGVMPRGHALGACAKSSPRLQGRSGADTRGTELGHRVFQANQLSAARGAPSGPELAPTFCRWTLSIRSLAYLLAVRRS